MLFGTLEKTKGRIQPQIYGSFINVFPSAYIQDLLDNKIYPINKAIFYQMALFI